MKKLWIFGLTVMLALALACCGGSSGSSNEGSNEVEPDTWYSVTSLQQLDGTWKGMYSDTKTLKKWYEDNGNTWTSEDQEIFGDMILRIDIELLFLINASAGTRSGSQKLTETFSGGKINEIWEDLKSGELDGPGITIDDSKHSASLTDNFGPEPFSEDDLNVAQINQYGTKVRMRADDLGYEGLLSEYIIFIKES